MIRRRILSAISILSTSALIAATLATTAPPAGATEYAPLDRPGPALTVPAAELQKALHCEGNFTTANNDQEPVLLSPATGVTSDQNYSWNYERAFTAQHRPWCALTMPFHTLGDIQTAGEYLVYAIRTMHDMTPTHQRIAVMGHSQGGMSMRWALRFWPDTRTMVEDVIGMAGSNHGSTGGSCQPGKTKCVPAAWQQQANAAFIAALNSGAETFSHIDYTEVFTHTDEVVKPNATDATSSSALRTGDGSITDVSTQDICPTDVYEHLMVGTIDPVTYALVMDALTHPGPADPSRINRAVCRQLYQPGVNPLNVNMYLQILKAIPSLVAPYAPGANLVGAPETTAEPALRCYVLAAGC